jgi:hypothetical protein
MNLKRENSNKIITKKFHESFFEFGFIDLYWFLWFLWFMVPFVRRCSLFSSASPSAQHLMAGDGGTIHDTVQSLFNHEYDSQAGHININPKLSLSLIYSLSQG